MPVRNLHQKPFDEWTGALPALTGALPNIYDFVDLPALQAHAAGRRGYEFVINYDINGKLQVVWDNPSIIKHLAGCSDEKSHETK